MKSLSQQIVINSTPHRVFEYMDEIGKSGMHMTKSSMPMMGGKLELVQLSQNPVGLHAKFRWQGKVLWMKLDFTVETTEWKENELKIWETIGEARMIILGWYRMSLKLSQVKEGTLAKLGISYTQPKNLFGKILAFFLADWYCRWCVNNMLNDSKLTLELSNK